MLETSNEALKIAQTAEIGLNGEMIKQLNALPEDVGTTAYESVKKRLINLVKVDTSIRFAYLYTKKGENIYFLADSEPITSKDYSPPGQEYTEAPNDFYQPFINGKALITKPTTDRWGTWVSVLVPMKDFETTETRAVFGIDYPANIWDDEAFLNSLKSAAIIFILIVLLIVLFFIVKNNFKKRESDKKYKYLFNYSQDAVLTLSPPDWKFSDGNPAALKIYGLEGENELRTVTPGDVSPQNQPDGSFSIEKAKEMINLAMTQGYTSFEWLHKKLHGSEFLANVSLVKIEIGKEIFLQAVVRDITEERKVFELIKKSEEESKKSLMEAERINKLMVGRELEMIQLKKKILELESNKQK